MSASSASRSFPFVLSCLLAPAGAAFADTSGSGKDELERVVVTANRDEQPLARVGDSVTLIEPEEVRASQKLAVSDLLATTPGITVTRNGGLGTTTQLRIRGAESDQTVVLIDGVKLNDPSSAGGGFDFGNLLTGDYMRIEVLRGPQSTLWGSQAIGGVINVVTTVPEGPLMTEYSAEGGARGSATVRARAEAGGERFAWRVAGQYLTTDGVSAFDDDLGGREKDGYRNVGANVRGLWRITDAVSAEVRTTYSRGRTDFDGFPAPFFELADTREYSDTNEVVAYAGVNAATFGGRLQNRFGFAYTDTDRENIDPDSSVRTTFDATGSNKRWEYQGTLTLTDSVGAVFGVESERSELNTRSPSEFDPNPVPLAHDAQLDSLYAQVTVAPIETLSLTGGLRYDDHDTFGSETTGRATLAWAATPTTIVRATYGEGFKAPTLFQLFSDFGNEDLAPERADAWDAGIEQHLLDDALVLSATYFGRNTRSMIDFVSCFPATDPRCATRPFGFYDNVQKTEAEGVELGLVARVGERLSVNVNYTDMDTKNRGAENFGLELARRPGQTLNGELTYDWAFGLTTTVAVTHAGRSFDDAANTVVNDGYTVVDLRAAYQVRENFELYTRLENAFDEEYETIARYGTPGRGVFVGVRQSF
ncbi:MAG TPA: TonB-dependent receptor [Steroidobacteraceae bacterium]|jgi:vitamin B12 transporter|nr:TonB-dependent receptor [Steroidobacteraceae bacterium]